MFVVKATSDDESTTSGPRVLAREERSADADWIIRTVDKFIVEDLLEEGKKHLAKNRLRQVAPAIPKGMPIQYYDADWFNNRPPHARAKLAAQRIVAFVPNSPGFLSGRADDGLTIKALTEKYGPEVFNDLDYRTGGEDSGGDGEKSGVNSDDSGESVGSRDSNDEESDADGISGPHVFLASFGNHIFSVLAK
ncbi:hypothetical protein B0H10DRAFT_2200406 [Mycena sp. CBHHK59/15]|nr:hypothetical protein B0H10DRAFT_2200406 [Mycena sp. CBHHK59/15]